MWLKATYLLFGNELFVKKLNHLSLRVLSTLVMVEVNINSFMLNIDILFEVLT